MSRQKPRLRSIFQNRRICEVGAWASQLSRCPRRLEAQEGLPSQEKTAEQNQLRDRSGLTPGSSPGLIWLLPSLAASLPARGSPLRLEGVFERAVSRRGGAVASIPEGLRLLPGPVCLEGRPELRVG